MKKPNNQNSYNSQIVDCINKYLAKFPDEKSKLLKLTEQLNNQNENICSRKNYIGHLTGSALFWNPFTDRVLLIHHKSLDLWIQPGGHLDPFELPVDGALREFEEEVKLPNTKLHDWHQKHMLPLDIDTHFIPANEKKGEPEHFHHDFLYILKPEITESDESKFEYSEFKIEYLEKELNGYKWVSLHQLMSGPYEKKLQRTAQKLTELIR